MSLLRLTILLISLLTYSISQAQKDSIWQTLTRTPSHVIKKSETTVAKYNAKTDSIVQSIQDIPAKYIKQVDKKIDKYTSRITGKTEKTLAKLSKWENKIRSLLQKASPETANRLFAPNQVTFGILLQKYNEGKVVVGTYRAKYDEYQDKLTSTLKYIETQKDKLETKYVKPITDATQKINKLEEDVANTEAVEKFIKERKKQLVEECIKYIGKSKYLTKIDKESYYYVETLKNYKELFSDPKKAEEVALKLLNKIPGFKSFLSSNSVLAGLFSSPGSSMSGNGTPIQGLQARYAVNQSLQQTIFTTTSNPTQYIQERVASAKSQLNTLKNKVNSLTGGSDELTMPNFKPNTQKSKTFMQRLEYGGNFQFARPSGLLPVAADITVTVGYKINDKGVVGFGGSYKLGIGNDFQNLHLSHQGVGFKTYIDWKIKGSFFITGGYEQNHFSEFKNIQQLRQYSTWQTSALLGVTKKYQITKKLKGNMQFLFDCLYSRHQPQTQPFVYRLGYTLK